MLAETNRVLRALTTAPESSATSTGASTGAVQDPLALLQAQLGSLRRLQKVALKETEERVALLDSGASHAYRGARDEEEKTEATPVNVKLRAK